MERHRHSVVALLSPGALSRRQTRKVRQVKRPCETDLGFYINLLRQNLLINNAPVTLERHAEELQVLCSLIAFLCARAGIPGWAIKTIDGQPYAVWPTEEGQ
jgi:hypothetical protein